MHRQQPKGEKIATILAVWLILEPLLAVLMLVFWGRQRDLIWLPVLIPALYLSFTGGLLQSCLLLITSSGKATSIALNAALGAGAAGIAFGVSVLIHDAHLSYPLDLHRLVSLIQVILLGPLVAVYCCVAIIRGTPVRQ